MERCSHTASALACYGRRRAANRQVGVSPTAQVCVATPSISAIGFRRIDAPSKGFATWPSTPAGSTVFAAGFGGRDGDADTTPLRTIRSSSAPSVVTPRRASARALTDSVVAHLGPARSAARSLGPRRHGLSRINDRLSAGRADDAPSKSTLFVTLRAWVASPSWSHVPPFSGGTAVVTATSSCPACWAVPGRTAGSASCRQPLA